MIVLDPEQGRDAPETRTVVYCDPYNGKLYDLPISSLVVLQTMFHLEALGLDFTDDNIQEHSAEVAENLILVGWFTDEEYLAEIVRTESEDVDSELKELLAGDE